MDNLLANVVSNIKCTLILINQKQKYLLYKSNYYIWGENMVIITTTATMRAINIHAQLVQNLLNDVRPADTVTDQGSKHGRNRFITQDIVLIAFKRFRVTIT